MIRLGQLRRRFYEKACALLGKVPVGREGGFEPTLRPPRNIPHFISFNPKVAPFSNVPKSILKAHMRIITHFLTRRIERDHFQGRPVEANLPSYLQVIERMNALREGGVSVEAECDLAQINEITRLYEGFVAQGKSEVYPPHQPFSSEEIELLDRILRSRRTVRCWTQKPVARETIETIVESAVWAPSTGNFQPVRYIVLDDPETKSKLSIGGVAGRDVPVMIAIAVDVRVYPSSSIGNKCQDAAAAIQNFLLKAHVMGLGAAWISGASVDGPAVRGLLNLPAYLENIAFIYLGWPANRPITPPRTDSREVVYYNRFTEEPSWSDH